MESGLKGISVRRLETFLTNLKNIFASSDQGKKADTAIQSVKIGSTEYKNGTSVTLPSYPSKMSDLTNDISAIKLASDDSYEELDIDE